MREIGFSEHAYRFRQARGLLNSQADAMYDEDIEEYIATIKAARQMGLPVRLGIEMDYVASREAGIRDFLASFPWDYIIGSVHWIEDWGFDLPSHAHEWRERDVVDVYYTYYEILQQAIRSQLFDIIGHFDVIKVFGYRPPVNINMSAVYESTVRLMKDYDTVFEISTAGLRKPVREIYPAMDILTLVAKHRLPVVVSSDAHYPADVGRDFELALQLARDVGIKTVVRFENRQRYYEDLS
ncbi:histidinol-phosphatase (PHP family) [Desulfurispira natronophila]|uniref:Histidinol-phosphatase n=1 Tax=Desulfurispira natronophila TaxID=682562 RepID=A0A7W8DGQ6_9BACT|nr:histidinol-phosphatase (PHP family) [Desulfurispira natronophila]